jgi:hypothetical protein
MGFSSINWSYPTNPANYNHFDEKSGDIFPNTTTG